VYGESIKRVDKGVVTYISGIQMARSKHPILMVDFVGGRSKVPFSVTRY
jgi:uncharacterized protein (DUF779 family)